MTIVWSGLAPHPPIIVASVGQQRCGEVQSTISAMNELAEACLAERPRRLVVVSPHTPRPPQGIAAWFGAWVQGNFGQFGASQTQINLPVDQAWMSSFRQKWASVYDLGTEPLDHGAMVPLYFWVEAGWDGPTCVLGLTRSESQELDALGKVIGELCADGVPTALLASGDMSHCLKPGAPAGYHEAGGQFDQAFVAGLECGDFQACLGLDSGLRDLACQDVVEACRVVWQASGFAGENRRFLNYEGPFGVGYTVMQFHGASL